MISAKTALRWTCATLASLVTGFYGMQMYAWADDTQTCGLSEVEAYQEALVSTTEEVTPKYTLRHSEAFIESCPLRFEVRGAYITAARAALDTGNAKLSSKYYAKAMSIGAHLTIAQRLDYSAALMATGNMESAAELRDSAILSWAISLTDDQTATLDSYDAKGGTIYAARFEAIDPAEKVSAIWIAAPNTGGFPASVIVRKDEQRGAWRALRTGTQPQALNVAELYRCQKKDLIADSETPLSYPELTKQATKALEAYLKAPDQTEKTAKGKPITSCYFPGRMFHRPNASTAIPIGDLAADMN